LCGVNAFGDIVVSNLSGDHMKDLLYIGLTLAFFGAMSVYVRVCAALAASDADAEAGGTR
jgi:hypothetical protein